MIGKEVEEACSGGKKGLLIQFVDVWSFVSVFLKWPSLSTPLVCIHLWKCTTLSGGDDQTSLKARKPFACHARLEQFWPAKVLRHSDYRKFWFLPRPIRISDVKKVAARCLGFQCCLCFLMERSSTENFVVIKYLDTIWHVLWVYDQLPVPNLNSDLSIALLRTRP